ncbi:hypothetical protein LCGC14_0297830 [marine sediment metagenome]|uniref:Uncharacterized protein n=1 Tax=marine sediment metagenome TaxID=412755 RepID=A0A0F9TW39_9ZZZZ
MAKAKTVPTKPEWAEAAAALKEAVKEKEIDAEAEWVLCGSTTIRVTDGYLEICDTLTGEECRELRDILNSMYPKDKD